MAMLGTNNKNTGLVAKSSAEEALIPSSIRFIYPTSTTAASATTLSSVTGVSRPGVVSIDALQVPTKSDRGQDQPHITVPPRPAQRTKIKLESDASTVQANGSSVSARPPAVPPRITTQQQQAQAAGGGLLSQQKTKKCPVPPPRKLVNNSPRHNDNAAASASQLSPKRAHSSHGGSTESSESEIRIQTLILFYPEFQSCTPEACKQALKKHKYEVDVVRKEIRVHMLMEMPHITTEDCRRALSHCQQKMDRAAAWLLEQSDDIERWQ